MTHPGGEQVEPEAEPESEEIAAAGVPEVPGIPPVEIEAFAREHRGFLQGLARKLCRDSYDPDDLVQDVLERVVKSFARHPPETNPRSWLARIMHNRFIDLVRRRQNQPGMQSYEDDRPGRAGDAGQPPVPPASWEGITIEQVQTKVAELPVEVREVYECHAILNLSYAEIASRLRLPLGTVGTRLQRARRLLRELLLGAGEDGRYD